MNIRLSKRSIQLLHDLVEIEMRNIKKEKELYKYLHYLSKLRNRLNIKYYHKKYDWYDKMVDEEKERGLNGK